MAETWDRACPLFEETVQIHTHNVCWQGPRRPLVLRVLRKADVSLAQLYSTVAHVSPSY